MANLTLKVLATVELNRFYVITLKETTYFNLIAMSVTSHQYKPDLRMNFF